MKVWILEYSRSMICGAVEIDVFWHESNPEYARTKSRDYVGEGDSWFRTKGRALAAARKRRAQDIKALNEKIHQAKIDIVRLERLNLYCNNKEK